MWTYYFFSKGDKRHYCLIRNLSMLLEDRTNHDGQNYYCNNCIHGFCRQELLKDHSPYCSPHGPQKLIFPKWEYDQWVLFKQVRKQLKVPYVIYLDLESLTLPIYSWFKSSTFLNHSLPKTRTLWIWLLCQMFWRQRDVYRGPNAMDHLFECLIREEDIIPNTSHVPIIAWRK